MKKLFKADHTFSSVKEFMEASERGEIKPHSTILIDERIVYVTGDIDKIPEGKRGTIRERYEQLERMRNDRRRD